MANQKLSELTAAGAIAPTDLLYLVDAGLTSHKITVGDLIGGGGTGIYNVRHYGATGDGVTDDSAAIAAAIAAADAAGGGTVFFPTGTYAATNIALAGVANIKLQGAGPGSILDNSGNNTCVFVASAGTNHLIIDSLAFLGDFDTAVVNHSYQGALEAKACTYIVICNCCFKNLCGDAITFGWGTTHVAIFGNHMNGGLGFVQMISTAALGWCQNVEIFGNSIIDTLSSPKPPSDGVGGTITGSDDLIDGWGVYDLSIYGNTFEMQGDSSCNTKCNHAILLAAAAAEFDCKNISIVGNVIKGQDHDAHFIDSAAILIDASQQHGNFRNITISGNAIYKCRNGIWLWGNSYPIVANGNHIWEASYDGIKTDGNYNLITGNIVDTPVHTGITAQGTGHNCTANQIYNLPGTAYGIYAPANDAIISNNGIHVGAAGTKGIVTEGNRNQVMFNTLANIAGTAIENYADYLHLIGNHYYNNGADFTEWGTNTITTLDE